MKFYIFLLTTLFNVFFIFSFAKISTNSIFIRSKEVKFNKKISSFLIKRQSDSNQSINNTSQNGPSIEWPNVDGSINDTIKMIDANITQTGYWYFNETFFFEIGELGKINTTESNEKANELLLNSTIEYLYIWINDCWTYSNKSAQENQRTNTLARVVALPLLDQNLLLVDDIYDATSPVELACFERDINGDPDIPLFNHTIPLMLSLKWDKDSAEEFVKEINAAVKANNGSTAKDFTNETDENDDDDCH